MNNAHGIGTARPKSGVPGHLPVGNLQGENEGTMSDKTGIDGKITKDDMGLMKKMISEMNKLGKDMKGGRLTQDEANKFLKICGKIRWRSNKMFSIRIKSSIKGEIPEDEADNQIKKLQNEIDELRVKAGLEKHFGD